MKQRDTIQLHDEKNKRGLHPETMGTGRIFALPNPKEVRPRDNQEGKAPESHEFQAQKYS
jgi:hypothetical protein